MSCSKKYLSIYTSVSFPQIPSDESQYLKLMLGCSELYRILFGYFHFAELGFLRILSSAEEMYWWTY
jgi:hypothetical protein